MSRQGAPFIVFEGGDGSGKTTQARLLFRRLQRTGIPSIFTRDPGGTDLGRQIERWLKRSNDVMPRNELLLFAASRSLLTDRVIRPALYSGKVVVCDRYAPSSTAYQGYGRTIDLELVETINQSATGGLRPDLVLLFDIQPEEGLARKGSGVADRFQEEGIAFHNRVRVGYLRMAAAAPERWTVLDATLPRSTLSASVWDRVSGMLESLKATETTGAAIR
ncbi:MAG: dTMP kinase [Chloroflexi bacterium]|nr:dTMP kinase [Chloroflexota bacterium]